MVVGILIALNLNNRNEEKKSLAKIESIFERVFEELESSIDETTELFRVNEELDSLRYMVVMNKLTLDDLKSFDSPDYNGIFDLNLNFRSVSLTQKSYDQLMQNIDNVPQEYLPLIDELVTLYETDKRRLWERQEELYAALKENIRKRAELEFYQNKYDLVLLANDQGFQDYILKDPRFKAETVHWMEAIKGQINHVQTFRERALKCYEMISSKLDLESKSAKWKIEETLIDSYNGKYRTSWGETIEQTVKNGYPYIKWGENDEFLIHKVDENTFAYGNLYLKFHVKNDSVFISSNRFNYGEDKGRFASKILNDSL